MGNSLEKIFANVREGVSLGVSIVTNQDNLVVSYAQGTLNYHPPLTTSKSLGKKGSPPQSWVIPARLSTTGGQPLKIFFSDRRLDIDPPPQPTPPDSFGNVAHPRQPFSANDFDEIGFSISQNHVSPPVAKFTLLSWDNATFTVALESRGNILTGVGPGGAVYVIAFSDWFEKIR
jgi:hypothetical protein